MYVIYNSKLEIISAILLLLSIISLFYYLRIVHYLLFGALGAGRVRGHNQMNSNGSYQDFNQAYVVILVNISIILLTINTSIIFLLA